MISRTSAGKQSLTPLQKRFIHSGFEGFEERQIVELLLSLVLSPRKSKSVARECIEQFQDLKGLLIALPKELEEIGLTPHCIFSIKLLRELPAEFLKQQIIEEPVHSSSENIFKYLYYSMRDLKKEVVKIIYLNSQNKIIDTEDLFEGTLDSVPIAPREIVESVLKHNASALIFAHNHPSGEPIPSRSDNQFSRDLVFMGMILNIKVLDHIIIGANRYYSFADEGLIEQYEDSFLNLKIRRFRKKFSGSN